VTPAPLQYAAPSRFHCSCPDPLGRPRPEPASTGLPYPRRASSKRVATGEPCQRAAVSHAAKTRRQTAETPLLGTEGPRSGNPGHNSCQAFFIPVAGSAQRPEFRQGPRGRFSK
jgi:hypothetical protein